MNYLLKLFCLGAIVLALSCKTEPKYSTEPITGTTTLSCRPGVFPCTSFEPDGSAQGMRGTMTTNLALIYVIINDGQKNLAFRVAKAELSQQLSTNQEYTFRWDWRKNSKHYESCGWVHTLETTLISVESAGSAVYNGKPSSTDGYDNMMQRNGGKPF